MSIEDIIVSKLKSLMIKCNNNELEILDNIIENKIEKQIEQQIDKDHAKQIYEDTLQNIISHFIEQNNNKYWFNKSNETYYIYSNNVLKSIHSDNIIIEITNMIPEEYYKNKNSFRRELLKKIQSNSMLNNIELTQTTIDFIKNLFSNFFSKEIYIEYVLTTIGYSIYSNAKNENEIDNNLLFYDDVINVWFGGQLVNDFLEAIKYWIYDITKIYPKFLTQIKTSYNNYNINKLNLVNFLNIDDTDLEKKYFQILKKHKMAIILTAIHYYKKFNTMSIIDITKYFNDIFYLKDIPDKKTLFKLYTQENIEKCSIGSLRLKDVSISITSYLQDNHLPENLFTNLEIKEYMDHFYVNFQDKRYSNTYHNITLKNNNITDIFTIFCEQYINPDNNNFIRLNELYFIFKKWYLDNYTETTCPTKNEIKMIMDNVYIDNWEISRQIYNKLVLVNYNKCDIFENFIIDNIILINDETQYIKLDDIIPVFNNWFNYNYTNIPIIGRDDIRDLLNIRYHKYYRKYKGWSNLKLLNNNCFTITYQDKIDIIKDIKLSSSV